MSFVCSKQLISNVNSAKECSVNYAHKCKRYEKTRTLRKILESYGCKKKYMKEISSTHMNRGVIGEPFSSFQQYSWHTFIKIFVFCIAIAHALTHVDQNSLLHTDIATSINKHIWLVLMFRYYMFLPVLFHDEEMNIHKQPK